MNALYLYFNLLGRGVEGHPSQMVTRVQFLLQATEPLLRKKSTVFLYRDTCVCLDPLLCCRQDGSLCYSAACSAGDLGSITG